MNKGNSEIDRKNYQMKLLKTLSITLAILFTLGGSISIVSLLMYFNEVYNISLGNCFLMAIILPKIYSVGVNLLLVPIDKKKNVVIKEIELLEQDDDNIIIENNLSLKVKERFDGLSRENRIKILNFIKENLNNVNRIDDINKLSFDELNLIINEIDIFSQEDNMIVMSGYSKKKTL